MKNIILPILLFINLGFSQGEGTDHAGDFFSNWWPELLMLQDTSLTHATGVQRVQDGRGNLTDIYIYPDGSIDIGGGGASSSQNSLVGAFYHFDGIDDYISTPDNADLDYGTADFSITLRFRTDNVAGTEYLINKEASGVGYGIYKTDDDIYIRFDDSANDDSAIILTAKIEVDTWYTLTIVFDRSDSAYAYIGNSTGSVDISGTALTLSNAGVMTIGSSTAGASFFSGAISHVLFFNRTLTSTEVAKFPTWDSKNPPVWFSEVGANNTALTSGTLVIGKRYRLTDWITNDDFTNVGAGSNADGVEFIATGTTPTTWTNSSEVTPIGCVVNYNESRMGTVLWYDDSGNQISATASAPLVGAYDMPSFRVYQETTGQTGIADETSVLIEWDYEDWDTHGNFNLSTERFTPEVAGRYLLIAGLIIEQDNILDGDWFILSIAKNGTAILSVQSTFTGTEKNFAPANLTKIIDANGIDDYFTVTVYTHINAGGNDTYANANNHLNTYFEGAGLR